jgi:hypothetical protein
LCDSPETNDRHDMVERHVTIVLPDDLPNTRYADLIRGLQGVLHAAGLGPASTIRPDLHISDCELNASHDEASLYDPWGP